MEYFRVSDKYFKQINHYKFRNPPWIKLYNDYLDDYNFSKLPDQKKYHFIAILLLSTRCDNSIIYDPLWITQKINACSKVDLDTLLELGFIEKIQNKNNENQENMNENKGLSNDASMALAECEQDASKVLVQSKRESRVEESRVEESALTRTNLLFNFKTAKFRTKVTTEHFDDLIKNYPRVNIRQELGKMNQWYCDHSEAKITAASFKAHVRKWMAREQGDPFTKCKQCGKEIQKPRTYCYECENKKTSQQPKTIKKVNEILKVI